MGRLNYKYQKKEATTPASPASSAPVLLFEKRVLTYVTFLLFLGLAIWMAAVFTDYWIVVVGHQEGPEVENKTFLWSHSGMWRRCDLYKTVENPTGNIHKRRQFGF